VKRAVSWCRKGGGGGSWGKRVKGERVEIPEGKREKPSVIGPCRVEGVCVKRSNKGCYGKKKHGYAKRMGFYGDLRRIVEKIDNGWRPRREHEGKEKKKQGNFDTSQKKSSRICPFAGGEKVAVRRCWKKGEGEKAKSKGLGLLRRWPGKGGRCSLNKKGLGKNQKRFKGPPCR